MNIRNRVPIFLLIVVMLALQVVPVSAQGKTPPNPDQLTLEQMKNAVVVSNGMDSNRSKIQGQIYRFANCDESNPDAPCYFMVTGSDNFGQNINLTPITPLASTATIICGRNIYNGTGKKVARLQQNVNVTFSGTYGQTPVTLNWGDLNGTTGTLGYGWSDLTGPNPSPGWGVYVPRSGTAYSTAGGMFVYLGVMQAYISIKITIRSSGWSCS